MASEEMGTVRLSDRFCVLKTLPDDDVAKPAGRGLRGRRRAQCCPWRIARILTGGGVAAAEPSANRPRRRDVRLVQAAASPKAPANASSTSSTCCSEAIVTHATCLGPLRHCIGSRSHGTW